MKTPHKIESKLNLVKPEYQKPVIADMVASRLASKARCRCAENDVVWTDNEG